MKKRRLLGTVLLSAVMGISTFASGAFGQQTSSQESYRVFIQGPAAERAQAKANYGARWDFGVEGFTTTVNSQQYQALLKNKNLTIENLPEI